MSGNIEPIVQGQVLFDIGQSINKCFILQKGSIHIINSRDEKVGGIGPNTMFGFTELVKGESEHCLLYTSPSPRDPKTSRMPSSA